VTPIGRPIPLPPGTHFVVLTHPQAAAPVKRTVTLAEGETATLDVAMPIADGAGAGSRETKGTDRATRASSGEDGGE
jgi:hypothetical protein